MFTPPPDHSIDADGILEWLNNYLRARRTSVADRLLHVGNKISSTLLAERKWDRCLVGEN
jgi:hypothetical protein